MEYHCPKSLPEALGLLRRYGSQAIPLAGGTDLMVEIREGKHQGAHVVDISRLPELKLLELKEGEVQLGAGITFSEILDSELLREQAGVLVQAASRIGSLQIRNLATVGGNVVHCSPCADSVPALLVLEARAVLQSAEGVRKVPLQEILVGPYRSGIRPGELLTHFVFQGASRFWSWFQKLARRNALAISRLSLAVLAQQNGEGLKELRIALGSGTPVPRRMEKVESFLLGKAPRERDLWEAGRLLASSMLEITGVRASTAYKEKAVQGLLVRALLPLVRNGN
jgi:CO/xanthine dehydrogenase FAD-binding subunit